MLHDLRNVVGTDINVGPSDDQQYAGRRAFNQAAGCFEDSYACAFGSHQRARHVKTVFGEQVVKVVSGNAARNVRELAADLLAVDDRRAL